MRPTVNFHLTWVGRIWFGFEACSRSAFLSCPIDLNFMCGIAGYKSARSFAPGTVEAMVAALRHRGPDSSGYFDDGDYHAGMCRLSIKDVSGVDQPLYNADRSVVLLYNGEIYNYWELRRELESK